MEKNSMGRQTMTLSSVADIPATDDTRDRLVASGVPLEDAAVMTEMGAQSLLVLRGAGEMIEPPLCHGKLYGQRGVLCSGCLFSVSCWRADEVFLARIASGEAQSPEGVPQSVVDERLLAIEGVPTSLEMPEVVVDLVVRNIDDIPAPPGMTFPDEGAGTDEPVEPVAPDTEMEVEPF